MKSFKETVYELCSEIAASFPGWRFVSGKFKNGALKHSEIVVDLGFSFDRGFADLDPIIEIRNKRFDALCSVIFDIKKSNSIPVSSVAFKVLEDSLKSQCSKMNLSALICADKVSYVESISADSNMSEDDKKAQIASALDIGEARAFIHAVMNDAISFVGSHYDLSSEGALLGGLPVQYDTRNKIPYDEFERQKGVALCVVRAMVGDFEFVIRYVSDEFQTIFPKRMNELMKIVDALPDLKARF